MSLIIIFLSSGSVYASGDISLESSMAELTSQAIKGDPEAQTYLGMHYAIGIGDSKTAAKWYRAAAEQDHAGAQMRLGWLYEKGEGVEQSDVKAFEWFQKSAAQGLESAIAALGDMYKEGRGTPQNTEKAEELYSTSY